MTAHASAASLEAASVHHPRRWLAAVVMMVAALMDMIDVTIVNSALPTIQRDLGAGGTQLEWVVAERAKSRGARTRQSAVPVSLASARRSIWRTRSPLRPSRSPTVRRLCSSP
jgi:hypothetical protein